MKKNPFKWLAIILFLGSLFLSTVAYVYMGIDMDAEQNDRLLEAETIDKAVSECLSTSITASKMMCRDPYLQNLLKNEEEQDSSTMVQTMRKYLTSIQKQFGFESVYVISKTTKKYYSYLGLNKTINPESDSFDSWYTNFINSGHEYFVESSTDEVNLNKETIFVDGRVESENGSLLGVSGVGIEMDTLTELLAQYAKEFGVRVDYVSADGLVQMSSQSGAAHSSYVSGVTFPEKSYEGFMYEPYGASGYSVAHYVPEFDWYLVIRNDTGFGKMSYNHRFFFAQLLLMIIGVVILIVASNYFKADSGVKTKGKEVDYDTGLLNRDYIFHIYGEKGTLNTIQYQSIAEFSIDDFDEVEKSAAVERILHSVVRTAREIFGQQGQIVRWNRSSFIVLLELPVDEADEVCRRFCRTIEDIGEVTVSVGLTKIELNETLKKNYYRAVQNMYLVKELGGNNVKKG